MKEKIEAILQDVRMDVDYNEEKYLVSQGVFESIDIITLIASLEDEFLIEIPTELVVAENFDSVAAIVALVESLISK